MQAPEESGRHLPWQGYDPCDENGHIAGQTDIFIRVPCKPHERLDDLY